jgi:hypothetical protein
LPSQYTEVFEKTEEVLILPSHCQKTFRSQNILFLMSMSTRVKSLSYSQSKELNILSINNLNITFEIILENYFLLVYNVTVN